MDSFMNFHMKGLNPQSVRTISKYNIVARKGIF